MRAIAPSGRTGAAHPPRRESPARDGGEAPGSGTCGESGVPAPAAPRVAYVVKMFPRFSETFILNELLELERRGFTITIYSLKQPRPGPVHPEVARLHARVVVLPERPIHWLTRGVRDAFTAFTARPGTVARMLGYVMTRGTHQAWKRFFQAASLAADLRRYPLQRLHAHFASAPSRVAWFAGRLAGLPFSFTAHAKDIFQEGTDFDLLRDKIAAAAFVVTVSDFNREHLDRLSGAGARIRRLYNGVDVGRFAPVPGRPREKVVLAAGRLVEKKGFDLLVSAWPAVLRSHPDARLTIVGEGPEGARLRGLARSLDIEGAITWAGAEPHDALHDRLSRARVFCLPCRVASDGNRDGLPTVLLEAMATGLPCVSTTITGIPEIVRDGCEGRIVPPDDPVALADALSALLDDPAACDAMGARARFRAETHFDLARNVGQLAGWFAEPA